MKKNGLITWNRKFWNPIKVFLIFSIFALSCNSNCKVKTHTYENGYVRFNYDETTAKTYGELNGKIKVEVSENWVEVTHLGKVLGEKHWLIPRERVVYIGQNIN